MEVSSGGNSMSSETTSGDAAAIAAAQAESVVHVLPQMLDLVQASHLRDDMVRVAGETNTVLDAAAVERMSTPCAQILIAAGRAAQATGKSFKITNASDVFRAGIADLGLQAEFSNWME